MKIFGVEILNEGSGVSIDDAVTEMQATFVARYVEPWTAVKGSGRLNQVPSFAVHSATFPFHSRPPEESPRHPRKWALFA